MFGHDDQQPDNHENVAVAAPTAGDYPAADPVASAAADDAAATTPLLTADEPTANSSFDSDTPAAAQPPDLLDIKQQALKQLSPLVGHLDQSPEEKFRTTMMMIQASDDQSLIKDAYAAAQAITDEKARAQALLDIVNEINYFTQHSTEVK